MEQIRIDAVFKFSEENCPERKRTTIVITEDGDDVHIGVKAIARVFELNEDGNLTVHEEQHGNICTLHKDAPLGCLFDSLMELFDTLPEIIDKR